MSLDNRDYMRDNRPGPDLFANITPLKIILAVNIVVFVLQHVFQVGMVEVFNEEKTQRMLTEGGALSLRSLTDGHVWTLVTHLFVHRDVFHIVFNMVMIYFAGRALESIIGPKKFVFLYFLSGFVAAAAQLLFTHLILGRDGSMIGASGAAYGLVLAFTAMVPNQVFMLIFPIPMRITARNLGRAAIIINLVLVIASPLFGFLKTIGHAAHLGGALAGLAYARFLGFGSGSRTYGGPTPRSKSKESKRPRSKVVDAKVVATQDYFSAEIDPILDKINREGMGSLTEEEKKTLQRGQKMISKKVDGA